MPGGLELLATGTFSSDGSSQNINLPGEPDLFEVFNLTKFGSAAGSTPMIRAQWIRGLDDGEAFVDNKTNGSSTIQITSMETSNGFTLVNTSDQAPGTLNSTITAISNAAIPVVSNSGTNGLAAGDVVRIIDVTTGQQLGGMDFTVGHNTLSSGTFSLDYMDQIASATSGSWRKINFDPIYYPRRRFITKITQASSAVVTLSVTHGYTVGQEVRFQVPSAFGMTEIDGLKGTITAVDTTLASGNTITVDIDSSSFTAFSFPVSADVPFTHAQVIPFGMDTAEALDSAVSILGDATDNEGSVQMRLGSSVVGASSDTIRWYAYKNVAL